MVRPASLIDGIVNAAGYKFYSQSTLNHEHLKRQSFIKRSLIGLTKDSGSIVGTLGGGVTFVSILNNLFNRDAADNSFFGIVKRWALPILSAVVSVFGLILSSRYDDKKVEQAKATNSVLKKVTTSIIENVRASAKEGNVQAFIQHEIIKPVAKLPNDLSGKEIKECLLELCKLKYERSDEGEYLQTTNINNEKIDGEEKTFALRFLINKGIDLKDTINKKSVLKLVSKNAGDLDSNYAVELSQKEIKISLLEFLGINFNNQDNKSETEMKSESALSSEPVILPLVRPSKAK